MKIGTNRPAIRPLLAAAAKAEIGPAPAPGEMGLVGIRPLSELGARQTQAALKWAALLNQNAALQPAPPAGTSTAAPGTAPKAALPRLASGEIDWNALLAQSGVSLNFPLPAAQNASPQAGETAQAGSPYPGAALPLPSLLEPGFVTSMGIAGRIALAASASGAAGAAFLGLGLDARARALLGLGPTPGVQPIWDVNAPSWSRGAGAPQPFKPTLNVQPTGPAPAAPPGVGPAPGSSVAEPKDLALIIGEIGSAQGAPPHFKAVFLPGKKAAGPPLIGSFRLDPETAGKWVDKGGEIVGWAQTASPGLQTALEPLGAGLEVLAIVVDGYGLYKAVAGGDWKAFSKYSLSATGSALNLAGTLTGQHQLSFIGLGVKTLQSPVVEFFSPKGAA